VAGTIRRYRAARSRLDTTWTQLPAAPGFVPFVDALVNRIVMGEANVAAAEARRAWSFGRAVQIRSARRCSVLTRANPT